MPKGLRVAIGPAAFTWGSDLVFEWTPTVSQVSSVVALVGAFLPSIGLALMVGGALYTSMQGGPLLLRFVAWARARMPGARLRAEESSISDYVTAMSKGKTHKDLARSRMRLKVRLETELKIPTPSLNDAAAWVLFLRALEPIAAVGDIKRARGLLGQVAEIQEAKAR